ncbi:putative UDP-glucuronosyltransferase 2B20-like [Triplophysa rosa]|uniref:UDP-glucuronosyltransferase n=1 Tax=Triplophysa rosa TaxID=992332 RepID=A0A9W8CBK3_TRIRA|nr:putative UDP-glucuronosyltransferase 2B20-like [Triplophysa rosa]
MKLLHSVVLNLKYNLKRVQQHVWVLAILTSHLWLSPLPGNCQNSSRILVVPVDGSHWLNIEIILKELHSQGHNLTVMRSNSSWYIPEKSLFYSTIFMRSLQDEIDLDIYIKMLRENLDGHSILAKELMLMFEDHAFMARLKEAKYDLILTDPGIPTGIFFGHYLNLPMVYNVWWINTGDSHFKFAPSPLSYVPMTGSELHDRMSFMQRIENTLLYLSSVLQQHLIINRPYRKLLDRYFQPGTTVIFMQLAADMCLVRADFVFELPRPTLPNVVYIGGFHCKPSKPLPAYLEEFVQASGEHGVVIMSLGTLISALPRKVTEYLGEKPSTLGNNTLLVKWLPQNDLLGHSKTRAFVAHGGTNGVYEAIYHGIPVLGLPLLFDQFDNILCLKVRGAARMLEVATLTKDDFLEAIKDILENRTYHENMLNLYAIFWIEYVIRHKGAPHLQTEAYRMSWYAYYSLDVACFLLAILASCLWMFLYLCKFLFLHFFTKKNKQE